MLAWLTMPALIMGCHGMVIAALAMNASPVIPIMWFSFVEVEGRRVTTRQLPYLFIVHTHGARVYGATGRFQRGCHVCIIVFLCKRFWL